MDDFLSRHPKELSGGQKQRVSIARALLKNPLVLILDEPTVGLDIKAQLGFVQLLRKIAQERTIILVTHHLEEIFEEINHVVLIKQGSIYAQGPKEEFLNDAHLSHVFDIPLRVQCEKGRYFVQSIGD
jgi:iron complex transport system ATP-binding protein